MHHNTAVRRLRTIAEDCDKLGSLLSGEDGLVAVYAFGPVLDRPGEELDAVNVALVLGLPAAELPWGVETPGCTSLAHLLRLDKAPVLRRWRPAEWPVARPWPRRSPANSRRRSRIFAQSEIATGTTPTGDARIVATADIPRIISGRPSTAISICSMLRRRLPRSSDSFHQHGTVPSSVWALLSQRRLDALVEEAIGALS
jgi:hypothetical protein